MKHIFISLCLLCGFLSAVAQNEITYTVSFPNATHHEAAITMIVPDITTKTLTVRMARSSPGRYATHEFGKNIYKLTATNTAGAALSVHQTEGDVYVISNPGTSVKVHYTLFGNWIDGTYAGIDRDYAHLNIPATFIFPTGMDARARKVQFVFPEKPEWKIATQLKPMGNNTFYARDFQYFMDSPIDIANYKTSSWEVSDKTGRKQTIHYVGVSADTQSAVDNFSTSLKKLVNEQMAVWGEFPKYDYGNYYFLHTASPSAAGDGMEHRNSTVITQPAVKLEGNESRLISTFSHEYFHSWNVERMRPKTLEPFNFTHSNVSDGLWMAEGFTQYYGNLILKRADFRSLEEFTQFASGIVNSMLNMPGSLNFSPIDASKYAVFADAAVAIDPTNKANIFTSYYTYGAGVALALELRLRADYNLTLDQYMRALWAAYGRTEIAYTIPDLEKTLAAVTKDPAFAKKFFQNYVYGFKKNDYAALLLKAGLVVKKARDVSYSGMRAIPGNNGLIVQATLVNTPAYNAGLDAGDVLLTIDGQDVKTPADFKRLVSDKKSGETLKVTYNHKGTNVNTNITLIDDPTLSIVPIEKDGGTLTDKMRDVRNNWLNTQIK